MAIIAAVYFLCVPYPWLWLKQMVAPEASVRRQVSALWPFAAAVWYSMLLDGSVQFLLLRALLNLSRTEEAYTHT